MLRVQILPEAAHISFYMSESLSTLCTSTTDPGEMELQRVVRGERDEEASAEVLGQRTAVVVQEEVVVAQRRHGDAHLG